MPAPPAPPAAALSRRPQRAAEAGESISLVSAVAEHFFEPADGDEGKIRASMRALEEAFLSVGGVQKAFHTSTLRIRVSQVPGLMKRGRMDKVKLEMIAARYRERLLKVRGRIEATVLPTTRSSTEFADDMAVVYWGHMLLDVCATRHRDVPPDVLASHFQEAVRHITAGGARAVPSFRRAAERVRLPPAAAAPAPAPAPAPPQPEAGPRLNKHSSAKQAALPPVSADGRRPKAPGQLPTHAGNGGMQRQEGQKPDFAELALVTIESVDSDKALADASADRRHSLPLLSSASPTERPSPFLLFPQESVDDDETSDAFSDAGSSMDRSLSLN